MWWVIFFISFTSFQLATLLKAIRLSLPTYRCLRIFTRLHFIIPLLPTLLTIRLIHRNLLTHTLLITFIAQPAWLLNFRLIYFMYCSFQWKRRISVLRNCLGFLGGLWSSKNVLFLPRLKASAYFLSLTRRRN